MRYDEYKVTEYYNKSKHLFLDFLNEKLNGDVEKLKGYCFDDFLLDLKEYQEGILNGDKKHTLYAYCYNTPELDGNKIKLYDEFRKALDKNWFYRDKDLFKILRENFYLNDFINERYMPFKVFHSTSIRDVVFLNKNSDLYILLSQEYLEKAVIIIEKRSEQIIKALKIYLDL